MPIRLDSADLQLIEALQEDGRRSYADLGQRVGLAVSTVNDRLKKLHGRGVIRDTVARVDPIALGLHVCAFVQVLNAEPEREPDILDHFRSMPEVQECHCVTGEYSFLLKVRAASTKALWVFLREQIHVIPGISRTNTMIALNSAKEETALPVYYPEDE